MAIKHLISLVFLSFLFSTNSIGQVTATITDHTFNCWSNGPGDDLEGSATGGSSPYDYDWYDSSWNLLVSQQNFYPHNTGYGTYHLIAKDNLGVSDTASITLSYQSFGVTVTPVELPNGANASCNGTDGQVDVVITGGNGPYLVKVYNWRIVENDFWLNAENGSIQANQIMQFYESSSTFSIDSLPGGMVDVVVVSDSGQTCSINHSAFMPVTELKMTLTGELYDNGYYVSCDTCSDGRFNLDVSGATRPYNATLWLDVDTIYTPDIFVSGSTLALPWEFKVGSYPDPSVVPSIVVDADSVVTTLKAGNWYLAGVIDANGCSVFQPLKIEKPKVPSGAWASVGNQVADTWRLGSINNEALNFITDDTIRMSIGAEGHVGIGITDMPATYLFAVGGSMIAEEVDVKLQGDWPDYVFDKGYNLMPLTELETFIEKNGHLPGFPSATELAERGSFSSGEMVQSLVEKVEELSLHVIQLQKEIDALKQQDVKMIKKLRKIRKVIKLKLGEDVENDN